MLGYCAKKYNCATYQEVIERVCGKAIGCTTEVFIILYMFGTSIAMLIIVGDQLDKSKCFFFNNFFPDFHQTLLNHFNSLRSYFSI